MPITREVGRLLNYKNKALKLKEKLESSHRNAVISILKHHEISGDVSNRLPVLGSDAAPIDVTMLRTRTSYKSSRKSVNPVMT
jgi:hypothetical protein